MASMEVYIVIINSSFFDDAIAKIHKVFVDKAKAKKCADDYESEMASFKDMKLPVLDRNSTDEDFDLYNNIDHANSFICCRVDEYTIQR